MTPDKWKKIDGWIIVTEKRPQICLFTENVASIIF